MVLACAPADPLVEALEQRNFWQVIPLNWVQDEAGVVSVSVRLSGPQRSGIEQLTVLVRLVDSTGNSVGEHWHTFDLSDIERGGPVDRFIRLRGIPPADQMDIDTLPVPTAEQQAQMPELQGLADS